MAMFGGIDASASGLTAERLRMDVISNNIANANTTRSEAGGPYKRRYVVFTPREKQNEAFDTILHHKLSNQTGNGVRAVAIREDETIGPLSYDPGHPDANADGYVQRPNVNIVAEMVDMITASRAYEANATAISAAKNMAQSAMNIGRS